MLVGQAGEDRHVMSGMRALLRMIRKGGGEQRMVLLDVQ